MPRYRRDYSGERRTEGLRVQLTPTERAALEASAERVGATLSEHARELCMRRSAAAAVVAGTRRNPTALALVTELNAIGKNLNQLAKVANTNQALPVREELTGVTDLLKAALHHVLTL